VVSLLPPAVLLLPNGTVLVNCISALPVDVDGGIAAD
jgi:hypothetical protein